VLKIGYFGRAIRNTWEVLKCVAGEGLRSGRSDRVKKEKKITLGQGGKEHATDSENKEGLLVWAHLD